MIPYGLQTIEDDDVQAVVDVLKSNRLSQGSNVNQFEADLASYAGTKYAAVLSNGTTALHATYFAFGLKSGDEIITTPLTFAATSNAALWQGAKPVFVDIGEDGNIDWRLIEAKITDKTKIIAPVDYMGRPACISEIMVLAKKFNLKVLEDACQALGAFVDGKPAGSQSDAAVFSFHPVKTITTGEGGAVITNDPEIYRLVKQFSTHGLTKTGLQNESLGGWYMEMQFLGQNYRLTDMQCALGISQLKKVDRFVAQRQVLVKRYNEAFAVCPDLILPPADTKEISSAWHLYVVRLAGKLVNKRAEFFAFLHEQGIAAQVHHIPVYFHPYYRDLGYKPGLCPRAEAWYESCLSLPLYPTLSVEDQDKVIEAVLTFLRIQQ